MDYRLIVAAFKTGVSVQSRAMTGKDFAKLLAALASSKETAQ